MKTPFSSKSKFIWITSLTLALTAGLFLRWTDANYFAPADTCEEVVRYMSGCSLSCSDSGPVGRYSCEKSIDEPGMQETVCTRHPYNPAITGRENGLYESSYQLGNCTVICGGGHAMCKGDAPVRTGSIPPSNTPPTLLTAVPGVLCNQAEDITYNGVTIQACNLGAEIVGTGVKSYGGYFQWGNNFMFPNSGNVNTSGTKINASAYGPSNPYSSPTFILTSNAWDSSVNHNLWGNNGSEIDRQGPCPMGYHVPHYTEINKLKTTFTDLTNILYLPLAGFRDFNTSNPQQQGTHGRYRTSQNGGYSGEAWALYFYNSNVLVDDHYRGGAYPIRCFKNSNGT